MAKYSTMLLVVWVCVAVLVEYHTKFGFLVTSQSFFPRLCHEEHRRCINDTTFQNCSDGRKPIVVKNDLKNTSAVVNSNATFKCRQGKVEGTIIGVQFDWIKWNKIAATYPVLDVDNGNFIDMQTNTAKHKQEPGVVEYGFHVSYLIIYNVSEDDVGLYTCVVCNAYGRDYSSAFLTLVQDNTSAATVEPISSTQVSPAQVTPSTFLSSTSSSQLSQRTKTLLGVVGAILCLAIIAGMLFVIWQKKGLRLRGMPLILFQPSSPEQGKDTPALSLNEQSDHLSGNQRTSLIPLIKNRNSSYRSQLSSAASGGTVLTYADDLFEYPLDENWEVERKSIVMKELLGEGAFGYVMKAEAYELPHTPTPCTVAVKMLKENATDAELSDLISEMQTMKDIGTHNNIVNFLGACTVQGPLLLVVEYCPNGNLRDFLRNHRPSLIDVANDSVPQLKIKDLLSFAYQIAKGMSYLSSKKCIHRDLAARNVLISGDFVVKIADFGLSRNLGNTDYYRKTTHGRLPVKWLPIEALFDQQYTVKSDVWSFGIILWEIFTLGGTPYPGIPVERLFTLLKNGYRMESPTNCLPNIYEMMLQCWSENAENRPSFSQLTSQLDDMLSSETRKDYVEVLAQSVDCLIQADVEDTDDTNTNKK